jgi:hypothetical protein
MRDTVLGPIGMTRSTYEQPLPKDRLAEVALPYRGNGQPVAGGPHTYPEMAAAALWTTPSDLARYAIEVQNALAGKSTRVIDAATARLMLTATLNDQGLGPGLGGSAGKRFFNHGGANEGYRCNLIAYNQGDGLVVMTNSDSGGQLASDILRTVAREYGWPDFQPVERVVAKVDPAAFDRYTGAYQLSPAATLTITRDGDQLSAQLTGQPKFPIFPQSERSFFLKVVDAQLEFDPGDKSPAVTLHQNGRDQRAPRVDGK